MTIIIAAGAVMCVNPGRNAMVEAVIAAHALAAVMITVEIIAVIALVRRIADHMGIIVVMMAAAALVGAVQMGRVVIMGTVSVQQILIMIQIIAVGAGIVVVVICAVMEAVTMVIGTITIAAVAGTVVILRGYHASMETVSEN